MLNCLGPMDMSLTITKTSHAHCCMFTYSSKTTMKKLSRVLSLATYTFWLNLSFNYLKLKL